MVISRICALVIFPTFEVRFFPDSLSFPIALRIIRDAGVVLHSFVKMTAIA